MATAFSLGSLGTDPKFLLCGMVKNVNS
jgi:hypothetical protein